jgi:hypothetical protein
MDIFGWRGIVNCLVWTERDSAKDQAVVFIFIFATVGLLIYAAIRPWVQKWAEVRVLLKVKVAPTHLLLEYQRAAKLCPNINGGSRGIVTPDVQFKMRFKLELMRLGVYQVSDSFKCSKYVTSGFCTWYMVYRTFRGSRFPSTSRKIKPNVQ